MALLINSDDGIYTYHFISVLHGSS